MIRKLRLKFICVNMLIVTVMLTGIFTMVYHFTRYGMETRSIAMLQAVASEPFQHNRPGDLLDGVQLPFFILDLDAAGNIMETDGYFDLSDLDYLQTLVSAADNAGGRDGVLSAYGLRFCRSITPPRGADRLRRYVQRTGHLVQSHKDLYSDWSGLLCRIPAHQLAAGPVGCQAGGNGVEAAAAIRGGCLP